MTTRVRLRSLVLIIAVLAAGIAEVVSAAAAHADVTSSLVEYPVPTTTSNKGGITTGPDGNLWWVGSGNVNTMSPAGGPVTQYPAAGVGAVSAITSGPDGNLWFTAKPNIGRITTAGVVTLFPAPTSFAQWQSITTGADGNLWFLYDGAFPAGAVPNLGKITTAGVVTTYNLARGGLATQIVAGPGGRLWWVDRNLAEVNSVDPADPVGTYTSYTNDMYPNANQPFSGSYSIAAGSDGNLWLSHSGNFSAMLRLTPAGALTVFPVDAYFYNSVALGPDGDIWFNGDSIGDRTQISRIAPNGAVDYFTMPHSVSPQAMTPGPDGNLWFVEGGSVVGRVTPPWPPPSLLNVASGFSSATGTTRLAGPGSALKFVFTAPNPATATDTTGPGLALYDSGPQLPTSTYSHTFDGAGTYTFADTLHPTHTGTVEVPPTTSTNYTYSGADGGGAYVVTWASAPPPANFEYDVQRQDPGGDFVDYIPATTDTQTVERPVEPSGTYAYRARLHRISDDAVSGWSPEVRVRYGSGVPAAFGGYSTQRSVFRPDSGGWFIDDGGPSTFFFGLPRDLPVPMDFNGDGAVDRAVYRPDVGAWYYDDGGPSTFYFGLAGDIPVPGDYNGDGITDRAVFRPDIGAWYIDDGGPTIKFFGVSGDVPVPGDYDGDGKTDEAVYRPSTGQWYVLRSSDSVVTVTNFGLSSDIPVPGDYDGDGKTDVAVFRPSTGSWFIHYSSGAPDTAVNYGLSVDIPVPGDYDADGKTDIAVYRRTAGAQWFIHPSGGGPDTVSNFGFASDIPLPLPAAIEQTYFP